MSAFSPHNKPLVSIYPIIPQRSRQGFSPAPTTSHVTHTSISPVASKLHIQYCQHFPCCIHVTHTILPAFSLLHPNYTYQHLSLLHPSYTCQHFPCCIQATHASIFPIAARLYMPVFSLLHPSYTCYPTTFPVASKLHMPALSMSQSNSHNQRFFNNIHSDS